MDSALGSNQPSGRARRRNDHDDVLDPDIVPAKAHTGDRPLLPAQPTGQHPPVMHERLTAILDELSALPPNTNNVDLKKWTAHEICSLPDDSLVRLAGIRLVDLPHRTPTLPPCVASLTQLTGLNLGDCAAQVLDLKSLTRLKSLTMGPCTALTSLSLPHGVTLETVPAAGDKCVVERSDPQGAWLYSHALPSRLYVSNGRDCVTNLNNVAKFSGPCPRLEEDDIVCRDISPYWLDVQPCLYPDEDPASKTVFEKDSYFGLSKEGDITQKVLLSHRQRYSELLFKGPRHLVDNVGFGRLLAEKFSQLARKQSAGFLAVTEMHSLSMTITRKDFPFYRPEEFVFRVHDPNFTLTHHRMVLQDANGIRAWELKKFPFAQYCHHAPMLTLGAWTHPSQARDKNHRVGLTIDELNADEQFQALLTHLLNSGMAADFESYANALKKHLAQHSIDEQRLVRLLTPRVGLKGGSCAYVRAVHYGHIGIFKSYIDLLAEFLRTGQLSRQSVCTILLDTNDKKQNMMSSLYVWERVRWFNYLINTLFPDLKTDENNELLMQLARPGDWLEVLIGRSESPTRRALEALPAPAENAMADAILSVLVETRLVFAIEYVAPIFFSNSPLFQAFRDAVSEDQ